MGKLEIALVTLLHLCCTNAEILRYEMPINHEQVNIVQVVTFDEEAGLRFVEVPKHMDLMKTLHVSSLQDGRLSLQVVEEMEACFIGKPMQQLNSKDEKEALGNFTQQFNKDNLFSTRQAVHKDYVFHLGAHITHSEIPPKLQPYCPSTYRVQAFKYLENKNPNSSKTVLIRDPDIQREYKNGDYLMTGEDFLPDGLNNVSHRVKRNTGCLALDNDGRLVDSGCLFHAVDCPENSPCSAQFIYQICARRTNGYSGCEFVLLCSTISGAQCIVHTTSSEYRCRPCCANVNCGDKLPQCSENVIGEDTTTRTLYMKMKMKKELTAVEYETNGAQIKIKYKGAVCETAAIPTAMSCIIDDPLCKRKMMFDTRAVLNNCWNLNIADDASTDPEDMIIQVKLPVSSPISISKVIVIDDKNRSRVWSAKWRDSNNNRQNNVWITGTGLDFDDDY
eukprot:GFUD01022303.1.p1 GENE.GFUD01022303.1~~GFUD01022303.1.p1  ORF type:complete len:448 (-),score=75.38 GFUD01022303.1:384-1727(-)